MSIGSVRATYNGRAICVVLLLMLHDEGGFLVSLRRNVSYSCSSTTAVSFPFGAVCGGGAGSWRPWAVMQARPGQAVERSRWAGLVWVVMRVTMGVGAGLGETGRGWM